MGKIPIYAPIQLKASNVFELKNVAQKLICHATPNPITRRDGLSVHDTSDGLLTKFLQIDDAPVNLQNTSSGYQSLNLTWIEDTPSSKKDQFYFDEKGVRRAFVFRDKAKWVWRDELEIDVFKDFVSSLGIEELSLVRLIYLEPSSVGDVHVDALPSSMQRYYKDKRGVSMTVNLQDGGATLHFLKDRKIHSVPEHTLCWHFDPSVPHSVGQVKDMRIQMRVFGSMPQEKYLGLLDMQKAIW